MVWLYLGMCSLILMLLSIPLTFYVMFKKLDAAERYLQHSDYVAGYRHIFRNAHFEGRQVRVVTMAIIILIPKVLQWRDLVQVEDVEKIPRHLKFWMVMPPLVAVVSIIGMAISWFFIEN
ncbi:hypothetical protein [Pseudomonas costantinii]|uniref:Uncharacterized protein n=1 Tax=Pseudomonas costantinii TaxID=168469 RepID=A0A1S2V3Y2_9PSED|nr:hypothetical protein [Pseudomonas costantinii]NVZ20644.1 hypothetical protein [Pseudomonas costantinii]OIN53432.1 hypothetical protein BFL40_10110 [Pseudomonas costantinii]SED32679.1 hypothetical protein SAMN04515675_0715 [Pseudomonas costantinii]